MLSIGKEVIMKCFSMILIASFAVVASYERVGFRAKLNTDVRIYYAQTVKFDSVVENYGGAYISGNGRFVCPVAGLYTFSVHLMSKTGYLEFAIVKGSAETPLANLLLQPIEGMWYVDSSTVTTHCNHYESVYVIASWGPGGSTVLHSVWNYFSGELISTA